MHTQEHNGIGIPRVTYSRDRTGAVTMDNLRSWVDQFRKEVIAGAMKIYYADSFHSAVKKRMHDSLDIPGHFQTGPGPVIRHEG
jgi:hypothetical protein